MRSRRNIVILTCLLALALTGLAAPSAGAQALGIGDQKPEVFQNPLFKSLGVKRTRLFMPYDAIFSEPARLDAWIQAARNAGLEPLIAFEKPRSMQCPGSRCRAPSVRAYTRAFRAFRAKYPGIRTISPWNEANSGTQPTGKNPRAAARYYNVARRYCRNCKIVTADVLDITNMRRWVTRFKRYARGNPRLYIWGLHNYGDTNRFRTRGARTLLRITERKSKIWLTETGGITYFATADGRVALPRSEARAARAMTYLLDRLRRLGGRRVQRIYLYNFIPAVNDRFDVGLLNADGTPREVYNVVARHRSLIR